MTEPSYTPQDWHDKPALDTPVDADRLNTLEAGVAAATERAVASVRTDAVQSLSPTEQAIAQVNMDGASATALALLQAEVTAGAHAVSTDGTDSLPAPAGTGLEFVITAAGLDDIRYNGTSL